MNYFILNVHCIRDLIFMMDIYFDDEDLEKLFQGEKLKGKPLYQDAVIQKFKKTVLKIDQFSRMEDLYQLKSLNFESLSGSKKGLYSVRVDSKYRLELTIERIEDNGLFIKDIIRIVRMSNHYS